MEICMKPLLLTGRSQITRGRSLLQSPGFGSQSSRRAAIVRASASEKSGGRQPWDFGRFVKTVLYFNEPPSPQQLVKSILEQPLKVLTAMTGQQTEERKTSVLTILAPQTLSPRDVSAGAGSGPSNQGGIVMVAGATGGVGKRVTEVLLKRGRRVRALVRDTKKAQQLLGGIKADPGGALEVAAADISQASTLLPELFEGVRALVICTAAKVAPKEGDTADRSKYYQGIKFYDPEIVGDTPEAVDFRGVQNLVEKAREHLGLAAGKVIFAPDGSGAAKGWGSLDDVVMGGVSESNFRTVPGEGETGGPAGVFSGNVSSDNSGGFVSVRTRNFEPALDLGAYEGLSLRVKGDGLRYKCIIRTDTNWDGVGYCKSFDTVAGEWQTVQLPFKDFIPTFRAKTVRDGRSLDPSSITSIQLMLSKFEYDGGLNPAFRLGAFKLPIQNVTAYPATPLTPKIVHVSSAGVTRPNRPGIKVEEEPPAVRMNDALGGILTRKLQGEDAVRSSGVPFAVVRPCALTEEPAGAELVFDQGDTIKGKVSRDDVAELCVELLSQPPAAGVTFEVKSTVPFSTPWQPDPSQPPPPRDWKGLLEGSGLRPGVTGKTVGGVYSGKEPEPAEAPAKQKVAA